MCMKSESELRLDRRSDRWWTYWSVLLDDAQRHAKLRATCGRTTACSLHVLRLQKNLVYNASLISIECAIQRRFCIVFEPRDAERLVDFEARRMWRLLL